MRYLLPSILSFLLLRADLLFFFCFAFSTVQSFICLILFFSFFHGIVGHHRQCQTFSIALSFLLCLAYSYVHVCHSFGQQTEAHYHLQKLNRNVKYLDVLNCSKKCRDVFFFRCSLSVALKMALEVVSTRDE